MSETPTPRVAPWDHATVRGWCPCKEGHPDKCKPEEHPGSDHMTARLPRLHSEGDDAR